MAGKPYGLKIIHKPSNTVKKELWFNTADERNVAMDSMKLHQNYTFDVEETKVKKSRVARVGD